MAYVFLICFRAITDSLAPKFHHLLSWQNVMVRLMPRALPSNSPLVRCVQIIAVGICPSINPSILPAIHQPLYGVFYDLWTLLQEVIS